MDMERDLELTSDHGCEFWLYNIPVQIYMPTENGPKARVVMYKPKENKCEVEYIPIGDIPAMCRNSSKLMRNLADLMDSMANGNIKTVCYPDANPS